MYRPLHPLSTILIFGLLLSACGNTVLPPADPTQQFTTTPLSTSTPLPPPTDTPVPESIILVVDPGSDPWVIEQVRATTVAAASAGGILFEERATLQASDLSTAVRAVVFLTPPADLAGLLAAAPATQFIVLSNADLPVASNLTTLRVKTSHQAFIAGYIGVLLSVDWRTAGLIPSETPELQQAFQNGGRYFCGTCSPGWPLGVLFPIIGSVSAADTAGWAASAADLFDNGKAEVFYLSPEASTQEVLAYLSGRKQFETLVRLVGTGTPPLGLEPQWAASVGIDISTVMEATITSALAGQSSGTVNVPVQITHVNPELLSPGRMNLVNKTLEELEAGMVIPESVPAD